MAYIDTSVLVAYYCPEPRSTQAEALLRADADPVVSALTEVEVFSALSRKVREGVLSADDAAAIRGALLGHISRGALRRVAVEAAHFKEARDRIADPHLPLRTLDALHLAVARLGALALVTADPRLAIAARATGVEVVEVP